MPAKRPRETVVTIGETRKSWDDVDKRTQNKRIKVALDVCDKLKVPPSVLADPSAPAVVLSPEATMAKLPRWTQRNAARTVGVPIASERQIHHKRLRDSDAAGIRVLVALRGVCGHVVLTEDEPVRDDVDFATVCADLIWINTLLKKRRTQSDISQSRISRVASYRIPLLPSHHLSPHVGTPLPSTSTMDNRTNAWQLTTDLPLVVISMQ